jgi:hypothetical protein
MSGYREAGEVERPEQKKLTLPQVSFISNSSWNGFKVASLRQYELHQVQRV